MSVQFQKKVHLSEKSSCIYLRGLPLFFKDELTHGETGALVALVSGDLESLLPWPF